MSDPQVEWTTLANSTYPERSTNGATVMFEESDSAAGTAGLSFGDKRRDGRAQRDDTGG